MQKQIIIAVALTLALLFTAMHSTIAGYAIESDAYLPFGILEPVW